MPRFDLVRRSRLVPLAVLLGSAILSPAAPALAHDECGNVSNCVSISSGVIQLGRSGSTSQVLSCPSTATNIVGTSWDKSSRAVTAMVLVAADHHATFTATNWSPTSAHSIVFYIGCVPTEPPPPHIPPR